MANVVLEYRRTEGMLSTGRVLVNDERVAEFEDIEFRKMLETFAAQLQTDERNEAVFQRTDRPGILPYKLDPQVLELFRNDPVAAIDSMCPPTSPSVAIDLSKRRSKPPAVPQIRAGFDTLADSFGDAVYTRFRDGKKAGAECPGCGMWVPVHVSTVQLPGLSELSYGNASMRCERNPNCPCHNHNIAVVLSERWAGMSTEALLQTSATRFYFPRAWNDGRPWIRRKDIEKKYAEYVSEKRRT